MEQTILGYTKPVSRSTYVGFCACFLVAEPRLLGGDENEAQESHFFRPISTLASRLANRGFAFKTEGLPAGFRVPFFLAHSHETSNKCACSEVTSADTSGGTHSPF